MLNKLEELIIQVDTYLPDIIGISESWANELVGDAELNIKNYNLFRSDRKKGRGGGVLLYVRDSIRATEVSTVEVFSEHVWCKIKTDHVTQELYIGVCYRSPNHKLFPDNSKELMNVINEMHGKPMILMGDFNYPDICWNSNSFKNTESGIFLDCIENNYLIQHSLDANRGTAILDLVFTSEPDLIDCVKVLSPLGSSDHNMLTWSANISSGQEFRKRLIRDYKKGDYVN